MGRRLPTPTSSSQHSRNTSTKIDEELNKTDEAIGHAATSMIENFTAHTGFHYRYGYHMKKFLEVLEIAKYYPANAVRMWCMTQPYGTRFRSYLQGIGRHENEEVWEFARKDLRALSALLGDKEYFFGSVPTTMDCVLFGHLTQFLYIDIGFPHKECLETECTNLVDLIERIKTNYWPDFEDIPSGN